MLPDFVDLQAKWKSLFCFICHPHLSVTSPCVRSSRAKAHTDSCAPLFNFNHIASTPCSFRSRWVTGQKLNSFQSDAGFRWVMDCCSFFHGQKFDVWGFFWRQKNKNNKPKVNTKAINHTERGGGVYSASQPCHFRIVLFVQQIHYRVGLTSLTQKGSRACGGSAMMNTATSVRRMTVAKTSKCGKLRLRLAKCSRPAAKCETIQTPTCLITLDLVDW